MLSYGSSETGNDCNSVITAFRQRFASPNEQFLQRQELKDRKQGNGESLSNYTEDIIRRCSRLGLNDTNRMNCSLSGLDDDLKCHVISNHPTTFEKAESLANLKDAVSKSTRCVIAESDCTIYKLPVGGKIGQNILELCCELDKTDANRQQT